MKKSHFALAVMFSLSALTACSSQQASSMADYIGIEAAKEAALKAAGVSADQAAFSSAGLDSKDGTFYYEVIFTENGNQREYDIDALTGVVIEEKIQPAAESAQTAASSSAPAAAASKDASAEASSGAPAAADGTGSGSSQAVTDSFALSIALSHAGLSDEDVSFSKVKSDFDDGLSIYEVEFVSADGTEYDYDISADDGTILSFNQDSEYAFPPSSGSSGIIDESQAKQAVLDRVPGAKAEDISIRLREDDGRTEYKGHLFYDDMMYEFKIDAFSGNLIEWEAELQRGRR